MNVSEAEILVHNLTRRHRELEQRRADLVRVREIVADDVATPREVREVLLAKHDGEYAALVTELEIIATELSAASRCLNEVQREQQRKEDQQDAALKAKRTTKRADVLSEAEDLAEQLDELLGAVSDVARKLGARMKEAAQLGGTDAHLWNRRASASLFCALRGAFRVEHQPPTTPTFSGLVAVVAGPKRRAA